MVKERDDAFVMIATFLAGICITCIILSYEMAMDMPISTSYYLITSLAFAFVFFTFTALNFTIKREQKITKIFFLFNFFAGFISLFFSLYLFLALLNQTIAEVTIGLAILCFVIFLALIYFEYK
jgi:hypothetical protein